MNAYPVVKVVGARGSDDFEGDLILELLSVDGRPVSIVGDMETREVFVIPSQFVKEEQ